MGTFNIPDGEVASAPVKTSVNGYITYNTETRYNGILFNNIRFEFKDGKIVNATSNKTKELNEICNIYRRFCKSNPLWSDYNPFIVLRLDLLHTISDLWYEQMKSDFKEGD